MFTIPVLLASFLASAPAKEPAKKNAQELEGKWQLVSSEEKGRPAVKETEMQTLTIKDGVMVSLRGKEESRVTFTIDRTKSPHHIDLIVSPDHVCHAIIKVDKDELVLCAGSNFNADKAEDRPKEFVTGPPDQRPQKGKLLFRYKKVKE